MRPAAANGDCVGVGLGPREVVGPLTTRKEKKEKKERNIYRNNEGVK